jgi:hypothetical protein
MGNTVHIIGCGDSAKHWSGQGPSIGVNDAGKWGYKLDSLVVCNRPQQFSKERLETIINTKVENFYSWRSVWMDWFPQWTKINLVPWYGSINPKQVYSSNTSPFIAISLAYMLGYDEIVLWGVDMSNHKVFHSHNPETQREADTYMQLINEMKGVDVYLGANGSVFDNYIRLWKDSA